MIKWFLEKRLYQSPKIAFRGRDVILRVRVKWLIFNMVLQLWADVKYHVPTGFGFSPKASGFYPFGDATALTGEGDAKRLFFLFQSPSIFPLSPSPSPQHNTTTPRKDLRKQIHKHEQPPAIYTDNQQVEAFLTKFTTLWTTTL